MKKNILIVGCSFSHTVYDNDIIHKSWPDWLSELYKDDLYVINLSMPGASNEIIKRIITKKIFEQKWDYVIVQWSTIDRWDYPTANEENPKIVRYWPNGSNLGDKREYFYKNYYSVYGAVIDTLENILFIQQLLESENLPYSMITIGNLFTLSTTIQQIKNLMESRGDYYRLRENVLEKIEKIFQSQEDIDSIPYLLKKIDYSKFKFTDNIRTPFGGGMLEWIYSEKKEYPKVHWHFDGEQSKNFLNEFILEKILKPNGIIK